MDLQGRIEMCLFCGGGEGRRGEKRWMDGCVGSGKVR